MNLCSSACWVRRKKDDVNLEMLMVDCCTVDFCDPEFTFILLPPSTIYIRVDTVGLLRETQSYFYVTYDDG